jgi:hypothetical protein
MTMKQGFAVIVDADGQGWILVSVAFAVTWYWA